MRSGLLITLAIAVGIICYHEIIKLSRVPRPEVFSYAAGAWAVLGLIAELGAYEIALALGVGIVLAMAYTFVIIGRPVVGYKEPGPKPPFGGNTSKHTE